MNESVLVVAPHPDDETLGCGGTILRHKHVGDKVHWLIMTQPGDRASAQERQMREDQIKKVGAILGFDSVRQADFPTAMLESIPMADLIAVVGQAIEDVKATTLYLPFLHDVHSDHRVVFHAAFGCTKPFRYSSLRRVYCMEIPSDTELVPQHAGNCFLPNVLVDISKHLDKKIEALLAYESEIGEHPFPRSERTLRALAEWRGASANCNAAEAFMLMKELVK